MPTSCLQHHARRSDRQGPAAPGRPQEPASWLVWLVYEKRRRFSLSLPPFRGNPPSPPQPRSLPGLYAELFALCTALFPADCATEPASAVQTWATLGLGDTAPPVAPTAAAVAAAAAHDLLPPLPQLVDALVVDGMGNRAEQLYAAHPERLFVIDLGLGGA